MTTPSTSRKLQCSRLLNVRTLLLAAAACAVLVSCSNSKSPSGEATGGSNTTNQGGSSSGVGGSGVGGSSVGGCGDGGGSVVDDAPAVVGQFTITLTPAKAGTPATTDANGWVYDALKAPVYIWTAVGCQGNINGCQILTPHAPDCSSSCDANSICISDGKCSPSPKMQNVGTVTITGFKSQGADATLTMKPLSDTNLNYLMPANFYPDSPPFADGAPIHFEAAGGVYSPFFMDVQGISPIQLAGPDPMPVTSETGEAIVTWTPGDSEARIQVELTFGLHGGAPIRILCDVEDTGSLTVPPSLVKELISLGTAGAPKAVVTRSRVTTAAIEPGNVALEITSMDQRLISIDGTITCNKDSDCPPGQSCVSLLCSG